MNSITSKTIFLYHWFPGSFGQEQIKNYTPKSRNSGFVNNTPIPACVHKMKPFSMCLSVYIKVESTGKATFTGKLCMGTLLVTHVYEHRKSSTYQPLLTERPFHREFDFAFFSINFFHNIPSDILRFQPTHTSSA